MFMALPDVEDTYRIILKQTFSGQEILNVFYYRDTAVGGPSATSVAQGFWDKVKVAWRNWLPLDAIAKFVQVDAEQLFGSHGFGTYAVPVGESLGLRTQSTDWYAPTVAALITLNVGTRVTRPGSKRIFGLLEGDVNSSSIIAAGTVTLLQALADVLDVTFTAAGTAINLTPVIVGYPGLRNPVGVRVQDVTSGIASQYISHQVSRDARP